MLCQKLLICDEYQQYRGRLGLLTPFRLTWRMVCREPLYVSFQGFAFHLLHVYARDWCRIWANFALTRRLALGIGLVRDAISRTVRAGVRRVRARGLFGAVAEGCALLRGRVRRRLGGKERTSSALMSGNDDPQEDGAEEDEQPAARQDSADQAQVPSTTGAQEQNGEPSDSNLNLARVLLKYLTEGMAYPLLIIHSRSVFVPAQMTRSDFWKLNWQVARLYGGFNLFEGLPLHLGTVIAEDAVQHLINGLLSWKLSDLSAMDLTMVRLSFSVLFNQFLSPFVQLVGLRRGEASYFIAKNRLAIQAVDVQKAGGLPSMLELPKAQPMGQLLQRMCLRTMLYQLVLTGMIVGVNYGAATAGATLSDNINDIKDHDDTVCCPPVGASFTADRDNTCSWAWRLRFFPHVQLEDDPAPWDPGFTSAPVVEHVHGALDITSDEDEGDRPPPPPCFNDRQYTFASCCQNQTIPTLPYGTAPPNHSKHWRLVVESKDLGAWHVRELEFYINKDCTVRATRSVALESGHHRLHFASHPFDPFSFGKYWLSSTAPRSSRNGSSSSNPYHYLGSKLVFAEKVYCVRILHENLPHVGPVAAQLRDPTTDKWVTVKRFATMVGGRSVYYRLMGAGTLEEEEVAESPLLYAGAADGVGASGEGDHGWEDARMALIKDRDFPDEDPIEG
eukprot:g8733.t1